MDVWPRFAASVACGFALAACGAGEGSADPEPDARPLRLTTSAQISGTEALLQAVSVVDDRVVWVSGHQGTYARTLDGGATWEAAVVPGARLEDGTVLQFRDIDAFDASTAYLMSAGPGARSRISRTDDGGATWALQYTATHPEAFLDCMAFWDVDHGFAYGDAVDGVPFILRTEDGGARWERVPPGALPGAQEGEGGFAASGTCARSGSEGRGWIAAGNAERARTFLTTDGGATWRPIDAPVVGGAAAGLTTIDVGPGGLGVALGGVIGNDTVRTENVAVTRDGGLTWSRATPPSMAGPVYGSALVPAADGAVVAVGPRGVVWSADLGATWLQLDTLTHWAVDFAASGRGWAVGPGGRITELRLRR